jgi:hypothetical protein
MKTKHKSYYLKKKAYHTEFLNQNLKSFRIKGK